jgi:GNAT superfamily N-acetyltransferase
VSRDPGGAAEIRRARLDDLEAIEACTRRAYRKYLERLGRAPQPMTRDYRDPIDAGTVWLIEDAGRCLGVLVLDPEPEQLLVYSVAVDPAHQGRGLGRRLMDFTRAEALRRGCRAVRLYTNERMAENVAYYQALGYRETHREFYKGSHIVHMRLELDGG